MVVRGYEACVTGIEVKGRGKGVEAGVKGKVRSRRGCVG